MQLEKYNYKSKDSRLSSAIAEWEFESFLSCETYVFPDGCRDLIVSQQSDQQPTWFVSELSRCAYSVGSKADVRMKGVRLRPGVTVLELELTSWLRGKNPDEILVSDQLDEFCLQSKDLNNALDCLASNECSVLSVAKQLGVSVRTLERFVKSATGETPKFWLSLGRVRRAGRFIDETNSLSEAAVEAGFADQSHMTREMRKWFQCTPNQLKTNKDLKSALAESGYAE